MSDKLCNCCCGEFNCDTNFEKGEYPIVCSCCKNFNSCDCPRKFLEIEKSNKEFMELGGDYILNFLLLLV